MNVSGFVRSELRTIGVLLRGIPSLFLTFFVLSVVCMNLLANKELFVTPYFALDCGFTLSWISFLCMDVLCKHFGAKAAVRVSVVALLINLAVCLIFNILSHTTGMWGSFYNYNDSDMATALVVNAELNNTFGGSWYVVLGSALAMLVSSMVNATVNHVIAKHTATTGFKNFALRSYLSTAIGQFVDNFVFALVVSHYFFGWSMTQVVLCSVAGAMFELLCEVAVSPLGYKICRSWECDNVGGEYLKMNVDNK